MMRAFVCVACVALVGCFAMGGKKKAAMAPAGGEAEQPVSQLDQEARIQAEATNAQISEDGSGAVAGSTGRRLNSLHDDAAVRHRRLVSWDDIVVDTSGQAVAQTPPSAPPPVQPLASPEPKQPEKLVIEAWLDMQTDNVGATVDAIRTRVEASGGRMVSENVSGSGASAASAALEFRVPPAQAISVATWLGTLGYITSKRVLSSDVSKKLFDYELALENLELTMERLQKLASQSGPIVDLLKIENEMTRVRGEIESIKGERRWLLDRVELATITVTITRIGNDPYEYEEVPEARVYPGPQLAILTLIDPGMRQRTRAGGGASIRLNRFATFELNLFPRGDNAMDTRAVLATFGTALYSNYLRDGRRRYLNPYVGARFGYGYLAGNGAPVVAAELGVELFKHEHLLVDSSVRAMAYVTSHTDAALHATLGVSVPF